MIEAIWAALLILAATHRHSWTLALLLVLKWFLNYAAFSYVAQWAPALVDIAAGTAGVILASRIREEWAGVVMVGFVVTPLIHGWYWIAPGVSSPLTYFHLITCVFTAQAAALAWPACHDPLRRLAVAVRGRLAGLAGPRRPGRDERTPA